MEIAGHRLGAGQSQDRGIDEIAVAATDRHVGREHERAVGERQIAMDDLESASVENRQAASRPDGNILIFDQEPLIDRALIDDRAVEQRSCPRAHQRGTQRPSRVAKNAIRAHKHGGTGARTGDRARVGDLADRAQVEHAVIGPLQRAAVGERAGRRTRIDVDTDIGCRDRAGVVEARERTARPDIHTVSPGGVDQAPGDVGQRAAGREHHGVAAADRSGVRERTDSRAVLAIEADAHATDRAGVVEERERLAEMEIDAVQPGGVDQAPGRIGHGAGRRDHRTVDSTNQGAGVRKRADDRPRHGLEAGVAAADRSGVVDRVCRARTDVDTATCGRDRSGVRERAERRARDAVHACAPGVDRAGVVEEREGPAGPEVDAGVRRAVDQSPSSVRHGATGGDHHAVVAAADRAGVRQRSDRRAIQAIETVAPGVDRAGIVEERERLAAEEKNAFVRRAIDQRPDGIGHGAGRREHRTADSTAHGARVRERADHRPLRGLKAGVAASYRPRVVEHVRRAGVDMDTATRARDRTGVDEAGERRSASPDEDAGVPRAVDQSPRSVRHGATGGDHHAVVAAADRAGVRERTDRRAIDAIEAVGHATDRAGVIEERECLAPVKIERVVGGGSDHAGGGVADGARVSNHHRVGAAERAGIRERADRHVGRGLEAAVITRHRA